MQKDFEGKRVALVGNAMSLFDTAYGAEIDDHEVVVRLNRAAMLWTEFGAEKSHGKKTTHWFFFNAREYKDRFPKLSPEIKKAHVSKHHQTQENKKLVDFMMSRAWHAELCTLSNHRNPTTGLMTLFCIDRWNPGVIDIYGFDWKTTPTFTDPERKKDPLCHHDFENERRFCAEAYLSKPNINLKA